MKNELDIKKEIDSAIERSRTNADPEWFREFFISIYVAATFFPNLTIDHVWDIFLRRGSGLRTHNNMAAGSAVWRSRIYDASVSMTRKPDEQLTLI